MEKNVNPIGAPAKDAEFQYLTDMNAQPILDAFQLAPEDLPGWAYLSKGTNGVGIDTGT